MRSETRGCPTGDCGRRWPVTYITRVVSVELSPKRRVEYKRRLKGPQQTASSKHESRNLQWQKDGGQKNGKQICIFLPPIFLPLRISNLFTADPRCGRG